MGRSGGKELGREACREARGDLQMAPELMLDLARRAAELVVERIESLPGENAWEGDFRQGLAAQLLEDPPEDGRPAAEVLRTGRARGSPGRNAARSSPFLRVYPDVAHLARGAGRLHGRRVQCQPMHLAGCQRSQPARVGRHRLVPALARQPASMPSSRRGKRRATPSARPCT